MIWKILHKSKLRNVNSKIAVIKKFKIVQEPIKYHGWYQISLKLRAYFIFVVGCFWIQTTRACLNTRTFWRVRLDRSIDSFSLAVAYTWSGESHESHFTSRFVGGWRFDIFDVVPKTNRTRGTIQPDADLSLLNIPCQYRRRMGVEKKIPFGKSP